MAVINCPKCKKKISDKAKECNHCQLDLVNLDSEKMQSLSTITLIEKQQKLMTLSFVAMLLFCGGFLFLYWQDAQPGTWQYVTSITSTVIGFFLYLIIRIQLIFLKRSK